MTQEMATISLYIRTGWAALGLVLGTIALIYVWNRWCRQKIQVTGMTKAMWWFQIPLTIVSGLFVIWITFAFRGMPFQLGLWGFLTLSTGSLICLGNALWLFAESSKKIPATL